LRSKSAQLLITGLNSADGAYRKAASWA